MTDREEIEMHVRFLLDVRGTAHRTSHKELVQYLMNKTNLGKTAARHAVNELIRNQKLAREGNIISLPN